MSDYLLREDAPISPETWAKIDEMVVTVARKNLVGRKVLEIAGPLGWGVGQAPIFGFGLSDDAWVAEAPQYTDLKEIAAEFTEEDIVALVERIRDHEIDHTAVFQYLLDEAKEKRSTETAEPPKDDDEPKGPPKPPSIGSLVSRG